MTLRNANGRPSWLTLPDAWVDRFAVTTDARGVATFDFLPPTLVPLTIRISGPGVAPHTIPLEGAQANAIVLKLGRPGRVVGIVRSTSGAPLGDVPVEIWFRARDAVPGDFLNRRIATDEVVRLDPGPLNTGPQAPSRRLPTS